MKKFHFMKLYSGFFDRLRGEVSCGKKFRPRRRRGFEGPEVLEFRRMLSVVLTGTTVNIDGTAGSDNVIINQDSTGVSVTENGFVTTLASPIQVNAINFSGGLGNDTVAITGILSGTTLDVTGGSGNNTLIGPNSNNVWQILGPNSGTLNGNTFTNMQNLAGGTGNDDFQFGPTGFVAGTLDGGGGGGNDLIDYSQRSIGVVVNLATGSATGVGSGFLNITGFIGSSDDTDQLIGANTSNTWNITSGNSGNINGQFSFVGVENLTGGNQTNSFVFYPAGFEAGNILGGSGNPAGNKLDYSQRSVGIVTNLRNNSSTAIGGTFSQIGQLVGSSAPDDTLIGDDVSNTWNITSGNSGNINGQFSFTGVENLTGGNQSDTFRFGVAGFVAGVINGGGGNNALDYSPRNVGVVVNLANSSATAVGSGFMNIGNLIGSTDTTDILLGANVANNWNITGPNSGDVNGFRFSGVENLTGGNQANTFKFVSSMSSTGSLAGSINGGTNPSQNTLDYSAYNTGVSVILTGGASGTATAVGGSFTNIRNLFGSGIQNQDALIGANVANNWNITGPNSGDVNGFNFSRVENLTGGSQADTFRFGVVGFVAGGIDGGDGKNTLDYSPRNVGVVVNLGNSSATAVGSGFVNIGNLIGSTDTTDILLGANVNNIWFIAGPNSGDVNGFNFSGVENLTGGNQSDPFLFTVAGKISGRIDGGGGNNTLDYSVPNYGVVDVNLENRSATAIGAGFANIQNLVGGNPNDHTVNLTGANVANTWNITGGNTGNVNGFNFTGVGNLTGGNQANTFKFVTSIISSGSLTGTINGGANPSQNTLDYSAYNTAASVILTGGAAGTATAVGGSFTNIQNLVGSGIQNQDMLTGSNVANTWNITGANSGNVNGFNFTSVENLTGGTQANTFVFGLGGSESGRINGGSNPAGNKLDYSAFRAPVDVNLTTGTATSVGGGISNLWNVLGGQGSNTLKSRYTGSLLDGHLGSTNLLSGVTGDTLLGGDGNDTIYVNTDGTTTKVTSPTNPTDVIYLPTLITAINAGAGSTPATVVNSGNAMSVSTGGGDNILVTGVLQDLTITTGSISGLSSVSPIGSSNSAGELIQINYANIGGNVTINGSQPGNANDKNTDDGLLISSTLIVGNLSATLAGGDDFYSQQLSQVQGNCSITLGNASNNQAFISGMNYSTAVTNYIGTDGSVNGSKTRLPTLNSPNMIGGQLTINGSSGTVNATLDNVSVEKLATFIGAAGQPNVLSLALTTFKSGSSVTNFTVVNPQ